MMKNYSINRIRKKHCYSLDELSILLSVHKKTISNWQKRGLYPIDDRKNNKLFYGEQVYDFLKTVMQKRRITLRENEFYCVACHKAVKGIPKTLQNTSTGKLLGPTTKQVIFSGNCENCGNDIRKFSSSNSEQFVEKKEETKAVYEETKEEQLTLSMFLDSETPNSEKNKT